MIYLDHAATSHPKPPAVVAAVLRWFTDLGVSAERGDSRLCEEVAREVRAARHALAELVGVPKGRIAFTSGATEALNLALRGVLRPGDAVLTTDTEHSSVARPLVHLRDELGIRFERVACDAFGRVDPADVEAALRRRRPALVVFNHASNVTGALQDAATICSVAREVGVLTLLDASQSAGLVSLAVGADLVAASTHKALLSPPALGFLAARPEVALRSAKQGGTGSSRALDRQPEEWPSLLEAGTPNTPAILGLAAALRLVHGQEAQRLRRGLAALDLLRAELERATRARFVSPPSGPRVPVLSLTIPGLDPAEAGSLLSDAGFHARTGFHCAPWIHERLGTAEAGTIRFSPGEELSAEAAAALARALTA